MEAMAHPPAGAAAEPLAEPTSASVHTLFKENYTGLWRFMRGLGVPPDRLDDAAQQVFLVFAERRAEVVRGSEKAFLFGTALRVARNMRRRVEREMPVELTEINSDTPDLDELTDQKRARALLDFILDQMEADLRTVFVLYEIEELTTPEIADIVAVPLGTAASRLRRARERFSELVKRCGKSRSGMRQGNAQPAEKAR
jgi:RNA polymerase sigma-70 factor (ECF subfamily)